MGQVQEQDGNAAGNLREKRGDGRVIFLDRDGTVNVETHYLHRPEDVRLLPGAAEGIRRFNDNGFQVVVISNQAGIGRGYYTEKEFRAVNQRLNQLLGEQGAHIDSFYFCPHHPEAGIGEYRRVCRCRKPDVGMFEEAEREFAVDKAHSYMIGDKRIDTQAGHNFGIRSVLVSTGYGKEEASQAQTEGKDKKDYEFYAATLEEAADWIFGEERKWNQ